MPEINISHMRWLFLEGRSEHYVIKTSVGYLGDTEHFVPKIFGKWLLLLLILINLFLVCQSEGVKEFNTTLNLI